MHNLRTALVIAAAVAAGSLGCADRRESIAREQLSSEISAQSAGALGLQTMIKTNGFDHEREGTKLYTVEWQALLKVNSSGWKAGWRDFQVLSAEPNFLAAAVEGLQVRRVVKGGTVELQGKSELQKADRGWRVLQAEVTGSKIILPPYALSSFSELPSFIQGCSTALALSEEEFRQGKYIYVDDLGAQAYIVAGGAPTTLRFARYLENGSEYSNGSLTVQLKIESTQKSGNEGETLRGELSVQHGSDVIAEKVYGRRGC